MADSITARLPRYLVVNAEERAIGVELESHRSIGFLVLSSFQSGPNTSITLLKSNSRVTLLKVWLIAKQTLEMIQGVEIVARK
jgi:hypothetical protein